MVLFLDKEEGFLLSPVLVEGRANSRMAILNRPSALNAITASMAARLNRLYESWEENSDIGFVMMKGVGRDHSALAQMLLHCINFSMKVGTNVDCWQTEECKAFFQSLYKFVYVLGTYLKPHVAVMDGIVMGGGAGLLNSGGSNMFSSGCRGFILSFSSPGYLGEYLALTGEKLNGVEMMTCGLATHYSLKEVSLPLPAYSLIETIDSLFSYDTMEEIVEALENKAAEPGNIWYATVLNKIKEASPLSLKVTLQSIREGRFQTLDQCLTREYRTSLKFISKHVSSDFCEGVRARLVDKDFAPKWSLPKLEEVTDDMVASFFSPLGEVEPELNLPVAVREPDV
ncbi:hypothetical protein DH2020_036519 [Rehmannia glutinosa]|uniref:3-hydroxyisobutyryl-CoA hydrolase n=1 Tax=Rehmannia glutinosa TaxID=99300 RepID=A0ABR0V4Q9_REHGL